MIYCDCREHYDVWVRAVVMWQLRPEFKANQAPKLSGVTIELQLKVRMCRPSQPYIFTLSPRSSLDNDFPLWVYEQLQHPWEDGEILKLFCIFEYNCVTEFQTARYCMPRRGSATKIHVKFQAWLNTQPTSSGNIKQTVTQITTLEILLQNILNISRKISSKV